LSCMVEGFRTRGLAAEQFSCGLGEGLQALLHSVSSQRATRLVVQINDSVAAFGLAGLVLGLFNLAAVLAERGIVAGPELVAGREAGLQSRTDGSASAASGASLRCDHKRSPDRPTRARSSGRAQQAGRPERHTSRTIDSAPTTRASPGLNSRYGSRPPRPRRPRMSTCHPVRAARWSSTPAL
jgi:hypothetical protein